MAVTITLSRVDRPAAGGFLVAFSDSNSIEAANVAALADFANGDPTSESDLCRRVLVRYWLNRDPSAENDNTIEGKTCAFDVAQNRAVMEVY